MKKSNYNFLIIIAMPMITFIVSILLLGLIEQTLSTLKPVENNTALPDLQRLPHQPVPTIHPKTERSMPFPNQNKINGTRKMTERKASTPLAVAAGLSCLLLSQSTVPTYFYVL